ncbi:major histocompatibility complex class I-related gene protein-like [Onychostoma macrolepis]|uniref:major histocompatibility complex class I-related gene protein-like n=1 Tax=Onychostoma macrolepis TaxID=369639 RepID=UPI00272B67DD|nr:major histocompatibility complex class I-related gene protein-like [Onychostoma macrolepis]
MRHVLLLLLGAHLAYAGTHSFKAFYTATTGVTNYPEFTAIGVVDGMLITHYDSISKQTVPRTEWMKNSEGPDYWKQQTEVIVGTEQTFKNNIQVAMGRFNQTGGVHTVQLMYGCEWDDQTEATNAFHQFGYDGEDFVALDFNELRFISAVQQGLLTAWKWNNDRGFLETDKHYLSAQCIEWLKKYLHYGKSSLEKTVSPQVSLLQKDPSSQVACHATGFYPSGVTISWMRNGQEHDEDVEVGELLPNEDGTFQKRSTITVTPEEWKNNKFSCVVEHQGKSVTEDEIRTNNGDSVPIGIIICAVVAVNTASSLLVLAICVRRKRYMLHEKKEKLASACSSVKNTESLKTCDDRIAGSKSLIPLDPGYCSNLDSGSDNGSVSSDSSSCDSTTTLLHKMTANDTR